MQFYQHLTKLFLFGLLACFSMGASAVLIGPGSSLTGNSLDTQDDRGRINIADGAGWLLDAGTYLADSFNFDAGSASSVTPFLAIRSSTSPEEYEVISVGDLLNVTSGDDQSSSYGGSDIFSLATSTEIFAGIVTFDAPNPINFSRGSTTAHDNVLSLSSIVVGTTIDALSHANLGRQYNFDISVEEVPEPTILALMGAGLAGLGFTRRRKLKA